MKYIHCEKIKMDRNGSSRYRYNFVDTEKLSETAKNNKEFSYFGRATKAGVVNQKAPFEMVDWMRKPFGVLGMPVMLRLNNVFKKINKYKKLHKCYHASKELSAELKEHSDRLKYVGEFLRLPINL